jgi:formylglycine-generating enzyme required for sulfatase activity
VFIKETEYDAGSQCYAPEKTKFEMRPERSFLNPGFKQNGNEPASCIIWDDANAYAVWLTKKTGRAYPVTHRGRVGVFGTGR